MTSVLKWLFIVFILLNSSTLFAQKILEINSEQSQYLLGSYVEVLEDSTLSWTIEQVISEKFDTQFRQSPLNARTYFGYTRSAFWVRIAIENNSLEHLWWLEIAYPLLNTINVYIPQKDGSIRITEMGTFKTFIERPIKHKNFLIPIELLQEKQFIYLKIQTQSSSSFPLTIWKPSKFVERQQTHNLGLGIYFGIVIVMLLYNFFLFLSLRDRNYIYYIIATFFIIITQSSVEGLGFNYLWPESIYWNNLAIAVLSGFSIAATCYFAYSFLELKKYFRVGAIILLAVGTLGLLLGFSAFFVGYQVSMKLLTIIALLNNPNLIVCAIISYRKGHRSALFFLVAWLGYFAGVSLILLRGLGILSNNFITANGVLIGSTMEVVFISLALADRINVLKQTVQEKELEKERIKRQEEEKRNQLIIKQKEELALKIEERTKELLVANQEIQKTNQEILAQQQEITQQNVQLQDLNNLKDRVFSIIAHDLRSPINSLHALLSLVNDSEVSQREMTLYIDRISENVAGVSGLLNNLLYWARSQMEEGLTLYPKNVNVQDFIKEVMHLFAENAAFKNIQTIVEVENDIGKVYVDPEILRFVLRNLLNNAYKFSRDNGRVSISVRQEAANAVKILIRDEGIGMDEATQQTLFKDFVKSKRGTRSEKGTGLGLMLCQELLARSQGQIEVESQIGEGSVFWFILPSNEL